MFQQILASLNSIPAEAWAVIVTTVLSAVMVSPLMSVIKKWFQIESEKHMLFFVMLGSMAAAAVTYLMTVPKFAPWFILVQGWLTFATTQPVYMYFVKPLSIKLGAWFTAKVSEATAINEAKNAAVPATGLPISATPPTDFSH